MKFDTEENRRKMYAFEKDVMELQSSPSIEEKTDLIEKHFPGKVLGTLANLDTKGIKRAVSFFKDS